MNLLFDGIWINLHHPSFDEIWLSCGKIYAFIYSICRAISSHANTIHHFLLSNFTSLLCTLAYK